MTNTAAQSWQQDAEAQILENLRRAYEERGFTFVAHPRGDAVPSFLAPYRPDAIARKPGESRVIEVKLRASRPSEPHLAAIRKRITDHPEWKLDVFYVGRNQSTLEDIPRYGIARIREEVDEVAKLNAAGHSRAAFLLAWSLLEAALNAVDTESASRGSNPRQVVQWLVMNGHIDPDSERRFRELADLRNRIAHGDLGADVPSDAIDQLLAAISEIQPVAAASPR